MCMYICMCMMHVRVHGVYMICVYDEYMCGIYECKCVMHVHVCVYDVCMFVHVCVPDVFV